MIFFDNGDIIENVRRCLFVLRQSPFLLHNYIIIVAMLRLLRERVFYSVVN